MQLLRLGRLHGVDRCNPVALQVLYSRGLNLLEEDEKSRAIFLRHFTALCVLCGRYWDRTSDPHNVNVVLYR